MRSFGSVGRYEFNSMGFVGFLTFVATIFFMILIYKFIVPEKRRVRLNKLGQFLHDAFNFKFLVIEKIMQFFYLLATVATVCFGISCLFGFSIYQSEYYNHSEWFGIYGILIAILGPIVIRLIYEGLMMFILLVKNVMQINKKLKNQTEDSAYQFPSFKELVAKENFQFMKTKKGSAPVVQPVYTPNVQPVQQPETEQAEQAQDQQG